MERIGCLWGLQVPLPWQGQSGRILPRSTRMWTPTVQSVSHVCTVWESRRELAVRVLLWNFVWIRRAVNLSKTGPWSAEPLNRQNWHQKFQCVQFVQFVLGHDQSDCFRCMVSHASVVIACQLTQQHTKGRFSSWCVRPDGAVVATASYDADVKIWDSRSHQPKGVRMELNRS